MALLQSRSLPPSGTLDGYIDRMAKGDRHGLELLYQAAAPGVYAYALSILKNSHDAEDILQEAFLSIYNNASTYVSQGKPMAWMLTITKNLCFKHLAELQRYSKTPADEWDGFTARQNTMATEDKLIIEACMKILSDDERQVVILHVVSGFKHREIAAMLNIPLSTVLSKYQRALKKMKASL